ncbi:zinc-dependent metalloprotease [Aureisphaera sp. CAU 1614]|uniref:Zinc-dependent metalloprotease n=1 Tax=Halomarinibacterium sedimenti TaxID=2857106 RepID=A0A9X1K043_9FLAO|nr:zinc-dependent metalloprotease [Halomarinibacterium sedimenti]MBW2938026.1 zinc-dependent metalloprotease [Halomarinibacterium sedimenti]
MRNLLLALIFTFGMTYVHAQFLDGKKNVQHFEGYFNFHYVEDEGNIYLEIPAATLNTEFLYVHSLRTGLGSNDIGLDRGQLGGGELVKFIKSGNKILLLQPNMNYRANTDNLLEKKSIEEAFARSVLFGFEIKENKQGVYLIDLTPFLMEDAHNVAQTLKRNKQGTYKLDKTRNTVWMERTKAFPKNVEFEAMLTYVGDSTGWDLRSVAPNSRAISVIQHHSFVELPEAGYIPREFDPRSGSYPMTYMDFATPVQEPITKRYITRHRLEKKDPTAAMSEAKEPIVYYLDPGTPEPIRSALLEGASWWNQAFEAIGYKDAFQVKILPENADPMDVRYNVIQWVHRSTRGWSYGSTINDPRTGEIIKGHVSLGSLRIRQDFMIAQALLNKPFAVSDDNYGPMLEMALARIRQLSAHEVGHTLGFAHNFAASISNRASVMDYPHPTLQLINGEVNLNNAYATGIGAWDKVTVAYSYGEAPNGDEKTYLKALLEGAFANGLRYITDGDARAKGGAHGKAHLWDNGESAWEELENLLKIREVAINNFSEDNIRTGEAYSMLEDVFVPLYFLHRYQTEATVKLIGGMEYDYLVKDYAGVQHNYLPKPEQKKALHAVLKTLTSKNLSIPETQLKLFPPRAFGYSRTRESFKSDIGVAFDALGAAATASDMTLELLLHTERANRLVQQKALQQDNLGFDEVLEDLLNTVFEDDLKSPYQKEVQHIIQYQMLQHLFALSLNKDALPQVKGSSLEAIEDIASELKRDKSPFAKQLLLEIDAFEEDPDDFKKVEVSKIPDGSPIGSFQCDMGY